MNEFLQKDSTGLWIVDVQERLFPKISHHEQILKTIDFSIRAARTLNLPIIVTEQYPEGLGSTISPVKEILADDQIIYRKTAFSGFYDPKIRKEVLKINVATWIIVGIEAHICILQTVKDLLASGKKVVVLKEGVGSRSESDFSTAIAELRQAGVRISCRETALYELIRDAASSEFKQLLPIIKEYA